MLCSRPASTSGSGTGTGTGTWDTATWDTCDFADHIDGYLDQFQTPGDGKVWFCHSLNGNSFNLIETSNAACIPHIVTQPHGRITSITSDAGKKGEEGQAIYSGAKAAIAGFSRALALELAPQGVTVNAIAPGLVNNAPLRERLVRPGFEHLAERWKAAVPIGRFIEPAEIAALVGACLEAAEGGVAILVDGFITTAAFAVAWLLEPAVKDYAFFSHVSVEPGHKSLHQLMDVRPLLDLELRLGEGTGAALAIPILDGAVAAHNEMATFESASVSDKAP